METNRQKIKTDLVVLFLSQASSFLQFLGSLGFWDFSWELLPYFYFLTTTKKKKKFSDTSQHISNTPTNTTILEKSVPLFFRLKKTDCRK
jgi:hypothetical protein